jgi:hypothetical protein
MANIRITVRNADKLAAALLKVPSAFKRIIAEAGKEAALEILNTEGIRRYPPANEGNQPGRFNMRTRRPMGYYVRGRTSYYPIMGVLAAKDTKSKARMRKMTGVAGYRAVVPYTSERYGTKYYVKSEGYTTIIGNSASYARYLTDDADQSRLMAARGWRKLYDVAVEKLPKLTRIYESWIDKMLKELDL